MSSSPPAAAGPGVDDTHYGRQAPSVWTASGPRAASDEEPVSRTRLTAGVLASTMATAVAIRVFERWVLARLDATHDAPDDAPHPVEVHTVSTRDGGNLYVEARGVGPPIVLLHGHGATLGTFVRLAPRLAAAGHRVIAFDQRGFGGSSPVPEGFGFDGLVADVAEVLRAFGVEDAVLVGHSMGGAVALGLGILHPDSLDEQIRGLVLLNSTARGPADDQLRRAWVAAMEWSAWERLSRHPRHGTVLTRANFGASPRRSDVEAARLVGLASPVTARRGLARRLLGTDLSADLGAVRVPVLALAGSRDRVVPAAETTRLAQLLPDATVEVLPDAGHMLPMERADVVAERIAEFCAGIGSGRRPPIGE